MKSTLAFPRRPSTPLLDAHAAFDRGDRHAFDPLVDTIANTLGHTGPHSRRLITDCLEFLGCIHRDHVDYPELETPNL